MTVDELVAIIEKCDYDGYCVDCPKRKLCDVGALSEYTLEQAFATGVLTPNPKKEGN